MKPFFSVQTWPLYIFICVKKCIYWKKYLKFKQASGSSMFDAYTRPEWQSIIERCIILSLDQLKYISFVKNCILTYNRKISEPNTWDSKSHQSTEFPNFESTSNKTCSNCLGIDTSSSLNSTQELKYRQIKLQLYLDVSGTVYETTNTSEQKVKG